MIIRYPKLIRGGTKIDQMALSIDLAPTLLEIGGAKPAGKIHGRSLLRLLRGEKADWRSSFLIEYFSDHTMPRTADMGYQALRTERWKYIHYTDLRDMDELYDLRSDPYEMQNLIGDSTASKNLDSLRTELERLVGS
jgi:arylsulfatase A-like enzyme